MRDGRDSAQSVIECRPFTRLIESKWAGREGHILSLSTAALIFRRRNAQTRRQPLGNALNGGIDVN